MIRLALAIICLSFAAPAQDVIYSAPTAHADGSISIIGYAVDGTEMLRVTGTVTTPPNLEAEWESTTGSGTTTWRVVTNCSRYISMEACWKAHNAAVAIGQRINKPL